MKADTFEILMRCEPRPYKTDEDLQFDAKAMKQIFRCKDCYYGEVSSMGHLVVCHHPFGLINPQIDSFCCYSMGKFREEVDDEAD